MRSRPNKHVEPRPFLRQCAFTGGVGSGEDLLEGVVDVTGQQRHVYGGNTDPHGASGVLRHLSIRHGSTNLGWNMSGNGQETDLLQLGACGSGTVVEHIELLASADDGLHIFGGLVEARRVMSAFHAEDAFESDQGWQGVGQHWFGLQDTALAQASNPPGRSFVYDAEGDDFEESNMDPTAEPFCTPDEQPHLGDQRGRLRSVLPQPARGRLDQQHCARGERRGD